MSWFLKHRTMINRAALILRYKEPAVRWINEADPSPGESPVSVADANQERTVYLVSEGDVATGKEMRRWVRANYQNLWETELEGWYTDDALWPKNRTLKEFDRWFEVECHSVLIDTVGGPLIDDDG